MKVPLEWLKEYVAVKLPPKQLAERLTMAGLEVTGIEEGGHGTVFDIEVTPNRADCLSMIGVAREVAACTGQQLKLPRPPAASKSSASSTLKITVEDRKDCSRYIGRLIDGVTLTPSPAWMQQRLAAAGARPINNLVDITNYVLLEYGQPLHAFDVDRLAGGEIRVRRAQANEPITTLDGTTHKLSVDALVIADAKRPVAVAGVMGGMGSEVTPQTKRVLLESARFDPLSVRRTARRLGLASESSYRFERGVDPAGVEAASRRAAQLMLELAGGKETAVRDVGEQAGAKAVRIPLDVARASRWLGTRIDPPMARTSLARLSCRVASTSSGMSVNPPSFRQDLASEVDLYEELARAIGYDAIAPSVPSGSIAQAAVSAPYRAAQSLRHLCAGAGLNEAITWSLLAESDLARHRLAPASAATLANPLSQDHMYVRPSLLPGLLRVAQRNVTQGNLDLRFFELGSVMAPEDVAHARESLRLGILITGLWSRDWRERLPADFFRLSGAIRQLLARAGAGPVRFVPKDAAWAEPGQAAAIEVDGRILGAAGQVSCAAAHGLDIDQEVWFGELAVDALLSAGSVHRAARTPPGFPPVKRDLSILVSQSTPFEDIRSAIRESGGALAAEIELIDRYAGKQVPAGQTSLTFSIDYRHPDRTLTASEADEAHRRIGDTLRQRFGATLR